MNLVIPRVRSSRAAKGNSANFAVLIHMCSPASRSAGIFVGSLLGAMYCVTLQSAGTMSSLASATTHAVLTQNSTNASHLRVIRIHGFHTAQITDNQTETVAQQMYMLSLLYVHPFVYHLCSFLLNIQYNLA